MTVKFKFCLVVYLRKKKIRNSEIIKDITINSHISNQTFYKNSEEKKWAKAFERPVELFPVQLLVKTDVLLPEHAAAFLTTLVLNLSKMKPKP